MPSDSTLIAAILPSADAFRSSLASTADQLRGLLASMDRGDEAELELETAALGGFAEGRIDVRRFLAVTAVVRDHLPVDASTPVLERAFSVLDELSKAGYSPFRVQVPSDSSLHTAVTGALSRIGRAFASARVAALVRAGSYDESEHEALFSSFDHRHWNATERSVAPPLEVEVDGADLHATALAEFLDGRQRIVLKVRGACPPAPLAHLVSRHTWVQQAAKEEELAGLTAWQGPAVAALVPEGCARFVHDPTQGGSLGERLRIDSLPEDGTVRPIGSWSQQQQLADLDHLRELAAARPLPTAESTAPSTSTAADHLAAFLLSRTQLTDD